MTTVTINGPQSVIVFVGETFNDPGASAVDIDDVPLEVTVAGIVDTREKSTHTLVYSACDDAGNFACVCRTVVVAETEGVD